MKASIKYFGALLCLCWCVCASLSAKVEKTAVYMFGFSASFTDSVAYITDIQRLDSVYMDTKNGFLIDRVVYSDQLQTYLEGILDMKNSTCVVLFDTKKKKLQTEYNKIRKRYEQDADVLLKPLENVGFRFQSSSHRIVPKSAMTAVEKPQTKKKRKKKKDTELR